MEDGAALEENSSMIKGVPTEASVRPPAEKGEELSLKKSLKFEIVAGFGIGA